MAMTEIEVEKEIDRLRKSPDVKLARRVERIKYQRINYMRTLQWYEKHGRELRHAGVTEEFLDRGCAEEVDDAEIE